MFEIEQIRLYTEVAEIKCDEESKSTSTATALGEDVQKPFSTTMVTHRFNRHRHPPFSTELLNNHLKGVDRFQDKHQT